LSSYTSLNKLVDESKVFRILKGEIPIDELETIEFLSLSEENLNFINQLNISEKDKMDLMRDITILSDEERTVFLEKIKKKERGK
jgi:hypothetical protein